MMTDIDQTDGQGKVCTKCGEWKLLVAYYTAKRPNGTNKFVAACKECTNAANREHARKNSAAAVERVRQWRKDPANLARKNELERNRRKDPEVARKHSESNKEWRKKPDVAEKINAKKRKKRKEDPEYRAKDLAYKEQYYRRPDVKARVLEKSRIEKSTREWKDNFNARRRERYAEDPEFFCAVQCRGFVVRTARKAKTKKSDNTITSLGYKPSQLRQRLECQFKPGMSWKNHGDWHIDHKKPIWAFIQQGIKDPKIINALCNLQPMWGEENQLKGAKWPMPSNDNVKKLENKTA